MLWKAMPPPFYSGKLGSYGFTLSLFGNLFMLTKEASLEVLTSYKNPFSIMTSNFNPLTVGRTLYMSFV